MKIMSRDFTTKEKALIVVLALILLALVYYYFVDQNVRTSIANSQSEEQSLQMQLDVVEARILHLKGLQTKMDELEASGQLTYMGSYNHSKAEVAFLNDILAGTLQYSIDFANVTRSGDQIRRNFTLQFKTISYQAAQDIMTRLCTGENRCLVGDVRCTIAAEGTVVIDASATFYETMVGGVADAALPVDRANVNQ